MHITIPHERIYLDNLLRIANAGCLSSCPSSFEGGGVAYLARFMVEKEISEGTLVEHAQKKPLLTELLLASKKRALRSRNAKEFLKLLCPPTDFPKTP
ncbi:MAG: hypothetical protein RLZZ399_393 [Verrucomicrobiota bacterium]|jgi:hypothetical protein